MSPMMKKVEVAGKKGLARKRKPYKIGADDFFKDRNDVRALFSRIVDCEASDVALVPSVSYVMSNVTRDLPRKKGKVILSGEQFPSNVYPWLSEKGIEVVFIEKPEFESTTSWSERILESINNDVVAVSIGHIHWADGTIFDLKAIRQRLDEVDGLLVIDGTQSIGALPFSVKEFRPDAVVAAGYKWLFGPYGSAFAYFSERFANGSPIEENWSNRKDAIQFSNLVNYTDEYAEGAAKFEAGQQSNFITLPMLKVALKQVLNWSVSEIQSYCKSISKEFLKEVQHLGFQTSEVRSDHLFGLTPPRGIDMDKINSQLKRDKISLSVRGNSLRISPNVYNEARDFDKLLNSLKAVVQ